MTRSEQHKLISDLAYYSAHMNRDDLYQFEILQSRDKDDEDLDSIARETLLRLHEQYHPKKAKKDAEEMWKKLTSGQHSGSPK